MNDIYLLNIRNHDFDHFIELNFKNDKNEIFVTYT